MREDLADGLGRVRDGNQTLARGLRVLLAIADSAHGLSVQQVGEILSVHRSIAYRLLITLVDFGLIVKDSAGLYIPGARLATLADAYLPTLRDVSLPVMRTLADDLQSTVSLFVEQGDDAVAIVIVEPTTAVHHIAFKPGMRTPLTHGAAAYALRASRPAVEGEPPAVSEARDRGYSYSYAEVEAGAHGVAAWLEPGIHLPPACLNLITFSDGVAGSAGPSMRAAAAEVTRRMRATA